MHRFFLTQESFQEGAVIFPEPVAHQLSRVLRLRPGEKIVALDNAGYEYEIILKQVEGNYAAGEVAGKNPCGNEPSIELSIYICLTQREKFEFILQKCTELGVSNIIPVISSRSLVQAQKDWRTRSTRYERIITEAAEQSRRGKVPRLQDIIKIDDIPVIDLKNELAYILYEGEKEQSLKQELKAAASNLIKRINVLIGPEGGLSADEVNTSINKGFIPVTIGRRILRMETAAIIACGIILYELGELD